jgi:hypothetical protein
MTNINDKEMVTLWEGKPAQILLDKWWQNRAGIEEQMKYGGGQLITSSSE